MGWSQSLFVHLFFILFLPFPLGVCLQHSVFAIEFRYESGSPGIQVLASDVELRPHDNQYGTVTKTDYSEACDQSNKKSCDQPPSYTPWNEKDDGFWDNILEEQTTVCMLRCCAHAHETRAGLIYHPHFALGWPRRHDAALQWLLRPKGSQ